MALLASPTSLLHLINTRLIQCLCAPRRSHEDVNHISTRGVVGLRLVLPCGAVCMCPSPKQEDEAFAVNLTDCNWHMLDMEGKHRITRFIFLNL